MATNAEHAASKADGAFDGIAELFNQFGALVSSITGFAIAVGLVWKSESEPLRWAVIGITGLILLFALIAQVIYPWLTKRRQQQVIDLVETDDAKPTTFRLRPYEASDHDAFDRPDGAHQQALYWLDKAESTCLYITGFSGTGKSSLLQAWLIPELAKAKHCQTTTVVIRSFADPIAQLVTVLKQGRAVPTELSADENNPRKLLEHAAHGVSDKKGRLLIAIDQFEECLILQNAETKSKLAALFNDLQKNPISGLQFLFVLRTDYLKFDELTALTLPDPIPRKNWFNLEALSHADARKILRSTLTGLSQNLEDQVVAEASAVDDLPGLIRPITLNIMGLVLQRFAGAALTQTTPGKLIQDFLRQAMAKPGIDHIAPKLLAQMITDQGTKKPTPEATLAQAVSAEPALARKTLYLLGEEGVVRELDRTQKIWEISHDFVARQLSQIIPRLRPSWWQQAQKAATLVTLVWLAIVTLGAGYPIYQIWRDATSIPDVDGVMIDGEEEAYRITFEGAKDGAFDQLLPRMKELNPVALRIIGNGQWQRLDSLDSLSALESLEIIDNDQLQTLPNLSSLSKLKNLEISGNSQLLSLPDLDNLSALENLTISDNGQLPSLPDLNNLSALKNLTIRDSGQLLSLPDLNNLSALEGLEIRRNGLLETVPSLEACTKLNKVEIWGNGNLSALPELGDSTRIKMIAFDSTSIDASIEALKNMPSTTLVKAGGGYIRQGYEKKLNDARTNLGLDPAKVEALEKG